ncbi:MAG TPA: hypothetical protein VFH43_11730 [Candidatus Kapabacteria bacterium]|jgi:hypothetical protein|nr:hypothetical protein [Candidatus Kapabacteria bacterium]
MKLRLLTILFSIALFAAGCNDNVTPPESKPLVSGPGTISFGDVESGECRDTTIRYDNLTGAAVTITSASFNDSNFAWSGGALPISIAAGASVDIKVRFCPRSEAPSSGKLVVKGTGGDSVSIVLQGNGIPSTFVAAKAGSSYTMQVETLDSASGETSTSTATYQIVADDITFEGRTDVRQFTKDGEEGTVSFVYNSDKSVSMHFGEGFPDWLLLPTNGGAGMTLDVFDTTIIYQGIPVQLSVDLSSKYDGTAPITVKGKTYQAKRILITTTTLVTTIGLEQKEEDVATIHWISELGFYGYRAGSHTDQTIMAGWQTETLVDYELVK